MGRNHTLKRTVGKIPNTSVIAKAAVPNWKLLNEDEPFYDKTTNQYCIVVATTEETINPAIVNQQKGPATEQGLRNLLSFYNKGLHSGHLQVAGGANDINATEDFIAEHLDAFVMTEKWHLDFRPCSRLRFLVCADAGVIDALPSKEPELVEQGEAAIVATYQLSYIEPMIRFVADKLDDYATDMLEYSGRTASPQVDLQYESRQLLQIIPALRKLLFFNNISLGDLTEKKEKPKSSSGMMGLVDSAWKSTKETADEVGEAGASLYEAIAGEDACKESDDRVTPPNIDEAGPIIQFGFTEEYDLVYVSHNLRLESVSGATARQNIKLKIGFETFKQNTPINYRRTRRYLVSLKEMEEQLSCPENPPWYKFTTDFTHGAADFIDNFMNSRRGREIIDKMKKTAYPTKTRGEKLAEDEKLNSLEEKQKQADRRDGEVDACSLFLSKESIDELLNEITNSKDAFEKIFNKVYSIDYLAGLALRAAASQLPPEMVKDKLFEVALWGMDKAELSCVAKKCLDAESASAFLAAIDTACSTQELVTPSIGSMTKELEEPGLWARLSSDSVDAKKLAKEKEDCIDLKCPVPAQLFGWRGHAEQAVSNRLDSLLAFDKNELCVVNISENEPTQSDPKKSLEDRLLNGLKGLLPDMPDFPVTDIMKGLYEGAKEAIEAALNELFVELVKGILRTLTNDIENILCNYDQLASLTEGTDSFALQNMFERQKQNAFDSIRKSFNDFGIPIPPDFFDEDGQPPADSPIIAFTDSVSMCLNPGELLSVFKGRPMSTEVSKIVENAAAEHLPFVPEPVMMNNILAHAATDLDLSIEDNRVQSVLVDNLCDFIDPAPYMRAMMKDRATIEQIDQMVAEKQEELLNAVADYAGILNSSNEELFKNALPAMACRDIPENCEDDPVTSGGRRDPLMPRDPPSIDHLNKAVMDAMFEAVEMQFNMETQNFVHATIKSNSRPLQEGDVEWRIYEQKIEAAEGPARTLLVNERDATQKNELAILPDLRSALSKKENFIINTDVGGEAPEPLIHPVGASIRFTLPIEVANTVAMEEFRRHNSLLDFYNNEMSGLQRRIAALKRELQATDAISLRRDSIGVELESLERQRNIFANNIRGEAEAIQEIRENRGTIITRLHEIIRHDIRTSAQQLPPQASAENIIIVPSTPEAMFRDEHITYFDMPSASPIISRVGAVTGADPFARPGRRGSFRIVGSSHSSDLMFSMVEGHPSWDLNEFWNLPSAQQTAFGNMICYNTAYDLSYRDRDAGQLVLSPSELKESPLFDIARKKIYSRTMQSIIHRITDRLAGSPVFDLNRADAKGLDRLRLVPPPAIECGENQKVWGGFMRFDSVKENARNEYKNTPCPPPPPPGTPPEPDPFEEVMMDAAIRLTVRLHVVELVIRNIFALSEFRMAGIFEDPQGSGDLIHSFLLNTIETKINEFLVNDTERQQFASQINKIVTKKYPEREEWPSPNALGVLIQEEADSVLEEFHEFMERKYPERDKMEVKDAVWASFPIAEAPESHIFDFHEIRGANGNLGEVVPPQFPYLLINAGGQGVLERPITKPASRPECYEDDAAVGFNEAKNCWPRPVYKIVGPHLIRRGGSGQSYSLVPQNQEFFGGGYFVKERIIKFTLRPDDYAAWAWGDDPVRGDASHLSLFNRLMEDPFFKPPDVKDYVVANIIIFRKRFNQHVREAYRVSMQPWHFGASPSEIEIAFGSRPSSVKHFSLDNYFEKLEYGYRLVYMVGPDRDSDLHTQLSEVFDGFGNSEELHNEMSMKKAYKIKIATSWTRSQGQLRSQYESLFSLPVLDPDSGVMRSLRGLEVGEFYGQRDVADDPGEGEIALVITNPDGLPDVPLIDPDTNLPGRAIFDWKGVGRDLKNHPDADLLFNFIFPVNRLMSLITIYCMHGSGLMEKKLNHAFDGTKVALRSLLNAMQPDGDDFYQYEDSAIAAAGGTAGMLGSANNSMSTGGTDAPGSAGMAAMTIPIILRMGAEQFDPSYSLMSKVDSVGALPPGPTLGALPYVAPVNLGGFGPPITPLGLAALATPLLPGMENERRRREAIAQGEQAPEEEFCVQKPPPEPGEQSS